MGVAFSPAHASRLAAQLPRESRSMRACMTDAQREEQAWTIDTAILARTYNILATFLYARTSESPPLIMPPSMRDTSEVENFALPEDEYERVMAMFEDHGEVI